MLQRKITIRKTKFGQKRLRGRRDATQQQREIFGICRRQAPLAVAQNNSMNGTAHLAVGRADTVVRLDRGPAAAETRERVKLR